MQGDIRNKEAGGNAKEISKAHERGMKDFGGNFRALVDDPAMI